MDYTFIDELKVQEKEILYNFLKEFPTIKVREALNKIDDMQGQKLIDCLNYLKREVEDKKVSNNIYSCTCNGGFYNGK